MPADTRTAGWLRRQQTALTALPPRSGVCLNRPRDSVALPGPGTARPRPWQSRYRSGGGPAPPGGPPRSGAGKPQIPRKSRPELRPARRGAASPEMMAWLKAVEAEVETRSGETRKALRLIADAEETLAAERGAHPHRGWTGSLRTGWSASRGTRCWQMASPDWRKTYSRVSWTVLPTPTRNSGR